jgi:primosomal protein N' (replication factor Y)
VAALRTVSVAVPVPRLDALTYTAPRDLVVEPGMRVLVPLGARAVTGCVIGVDDRDVDPPARSSIKPVMRVLDEAPLVPAETLALALWTAEYYLCGPGEAVALTMPPAARARADAFKRQRVAVITDAGRKALDGQERLTETQRALLTRLAVEDACPVADLLRDGTSDAVLARLKDRGLVDVTRETIERDPLIGSDASAPVGKGGESPLDLPLTAEQSVALASLESLASADAFAVALLHGVTGSGKTQVYLRLADAVRRRGRRVLILVPEIALTPAMAGFMAQAFGARVAVQHSGLSDGERHDQWHRIRRGDVDIVVGTRSAVFAPLGNVGLIVVDEEHDTSYKQDESPRYHGRDVAVVRAKASGALAVLGSATPSLESYQHAQSGRYQLVTLDKRVFDRPLASVVVVDMRKVFAEEGPDAVLSPPLRAALASRLEAREQSVVLLNRRGYAAALFCRQCGSTLECPNCSITLTVHRSAALARCHYCDHARRVPPACPTCGGEFLDYRGIGTERIEAEIRGLLPDARVTRVDRDTVRRRGAVARILGAFGRRELDVLVGTQMIAKGHDFPAVTLVGVVSADVGLGVADFRAAERTFQLLTQVVGRAGRGTRRGEAIVQTLYPGHYSIVHASRQDYRCFFDAELVFRRAMHYPPTQSLVNLVVKGSTPGATDSDAARLARALRAGRQAFDVLGPAAAPLPRLRGEYRVQLFLKGTHRAAMRRAIVRALEELPQIARRTTVDVDPLSML